MSDWKRREYEAARRNDRRAFAIVLLVVGGIAIFWLTVWSAVFVAAVRFLWSVL